MAHYSVAEAKNALPRLLDKACAGEEVVITRRGVVIAEIRPKQSPVHGGADIYERLSVARAKMKPLTGLGADMVSQMRDEDWR